MSEALIIWCAHIYCSQEINGSSYKRKEQLEEEVGFVEAWEEVTTRTC